MQIGKLFIIIAFISGIVSTIYYFMLTRQNIGKKQKDKSVNVFNIKLARGSFYLMAIFTTIATFYLIYLFLSHQFQFRYVFQYSSRSLNFGLLLSSLWAGQQGSFLLWTMMTAVMGVIFLKYAQQFENWAMFFVNIIQIFFFLLLLKASPFELQAQTPADGAGLNPLLQNFWMVIHPPILFLGYAAITFPFVLALSALVLKSYREWIVKAMPWTIFSSITLGAGIIIGAFWAYETLGWGGYWGWDPVENSSLIPWLTILALMHGFIVQKRNGALSRTNFSFAVISYLLVLYATFLTRSGILADFSVHSFQDLGINSYLILFIGLAFAVSLALLAWRFKKIPGQAIDLSSPNRENALSASLWIFAAAGFLIFIGTSSPIITGLIGTASQVDTSFYNKVNLPIGIIMGLLLGITPFLLWIENDVISIFKRLSAPFTVAVVAAVIAYITGLTGILDVLFVFTGVFALVSNIIVVIRQLKPNWLNISAPLSHFGVAVMFLGIIISANFSSEERVLLVKNNSSSVLGYNLTYRGYISSPDGKNMARIEVSRGSSSFMAEPRLYNTKYGEGVMREPHVSPGFLTDLYISPLEVRTGQTEDSGTMISLVKGETKTVGEYSITFTGFEMANHEEQGSFSVGALLDVTIGSDRYRVIPSMLIGAEGRQTRPATLPHEENHESNIHPAVILQGMNADEKRIDLAVRGVNGQNHSHTSEQLLVEISTKPFMSILWAGTVLLVLGSIIALRKRMVTV